ncbi:copper(I)-binding protein [Microbacterium resistens]|uniref:Copper(I)-binding protein n=1 Tax=Microbacterium resistens TaxID=156977 RepID=A0ABU1SAV6_9MICO|nr:copper chaperone PCu(A)C [Microbacterium resistens]MDR6866691.1 copper(I)-binding protein [Microbacterium resistens]
MNANDRTQTISAPIGSLPLTPTAPHVRTARTARTGRVARAGGVAAVLLLALSGCAGTAGAAPTPSASSATAAAGITVTDAWVKAADSGMSAAFGEIENTGSADVTLVSAETAVSPMVQLHETTANESGQMEMREKDGGFAITAGGTLTLQPGGDHIMLMGLAAPLKAGDEVTLTLIFSDGSSSTVTAPIKDYAGANETYSDEHSGHGGSGGSTGSDR